MFSLVKERAKQKPNEDILVTSNDDDVMAYVKSVEIHCQPPHISTSVLWTIKAHLHHAISRAATLGGRKFKRWKGYRVANSLLSQLQHFAQGDAQHCGNGQVVSSQIRSVRVAWTREFVVGFTNYSTDTQIHHCMETNMVSTIKYIRKRSGNTSTQRERSTQRHVGLREHVSVGRKAIRRHISRQPQLEFNKKRPPVETFT